MLRECCRCIRGSGESTHYPLAANIALEDGQAILGADVLPEDALVGSCRGSGGEGEDGSGDLHCDCYDFEAYDY